MEGGGRRIYGISRGKRNQQCSSQGPKVPQIDFFYSKPFHSKGFYSFPFSILVLAATCLWWSNNCWLCSCSLCSETLNILASLMFDFNVCLNVWLALNWQGAKTFAKFERIFDTFWAGFLFLIYLLVEVNFGDNIMTVCCWILNLVLFIYRKGKKRFQRIGVVEKHCSLPH